MTRALYFDCFAGASGDMIVGALLDLGLDFELLKQQLALLPVSGYEVSASRVTRSGIAATKFDVDVQAQDQPRRGLTEIRDLINNSKISDRAKSTALTIFRRLAEAEARVHGTSIEQVHFHEVGAVDSIVDIVGAAIGFDALGIERFFSSPVRLGYGIINTAHGILPVPGPATADLLNGAPVYAGEIEGEFVTPTGAAILSTLCSFEPMPAIRLRSAGYGAGTRDPKGLPNLIRAIVGDLDDASDSASMNAPYLDSERILVIETNIDDMNPQVYGYIFERAFELDALDVFTTPIQMKKDRPATKLTVLAKPDHSNALIDLLLRETTTLGVRYYEASRRILTREIVTVDTEYGPVRVKVARSGERTLHFQAEFEDCARVARQSGVPLIDVQNTANSAFGRHERARMGTETDNSKE